MDKDVQHISLPVLICCEGEPPTIQHLNMTLYDTPHLDLVRDPDPQRAYPGNGHRGDDLVCRSQTDVSASYGHLSVQERRQGHLVELLRVLDSDNSLAGGT